MAFITQRGAKNEEYRNRAADEIAELEALVSGVNQISQSTLLLKKKKEMHEVDDALDFMKEEYKTRIEACEERQREFERRQADMKEQVTKFEKFIQENDSKRQRAEMKAKQEEKQKYQKDGELAKLQHEHEDAETKRAEALAELKTLEKYKKYLEGTVEDAEDETYEEVWDLLNRHKTLMNANRDLMKVGEKGDHDMDDLRSKLQELQLETQTKTLAGNSHIHALQKHLEELRASSKKASDDKETEEERIKDVNRETGQVVLAIRNLYHRCLATMHARVVPVTISDKDDPELKLGQLVQCLTMICERIVDLRDIDEGKSAYEDKLAAAAAAQQQAQALLGAPSPSAAQPPEGGAGSTKGGSIG